jgi:hypothetical protein
LRLYLFCTLLVVGPRCPQIGSSCCWSVISMGLSGRYTHRVAISNHRLVSFADGKVTFRWRDSAHSNEQKLMTISLDEFLRRFLLHLLPKGFVRIRNFGFLANRKRATTLPLSFQLLGGAPQTEQQASTAGPSDLWSCPKCGGPMMVVERLTAAEIQLRSPPLVTLRHDATLSNSKLFFHALRTSVPCLETAVFFQLFDHATHDPFSHSANFRPHTVTLRALPHSLGTVRRHSCPPLNLHRARVRRKIAGGFLQVVVSTAREHTMLVQAHCPSRFRYNPKTSCYLSAFPDLDYFRLADKD